jgi:hypothetical protein
MKIAFPLLAFVVVVFGSAVVPVQAAEKDPKVGAEKKVEHRTTRDAVIGGTWTWESKDPADATTIQFAADGTTLRGAAKWEATANREITITHPTRGKAVIRLGGNSQSFKGTGFDGKPVTGDKTGWK